VESVEEKEMLAYYQSDARKTSPLAFIDETTIEVFEKHCLTAGVHIRRYCPTIYARTLNCMLSGKDRANKIQ